MKIPDNQSLSPVTKLALFILLLLLALPVVSQPDLHVVDQVRIGEDLSFPSVFGELKHEGGSTGFIINANANGSWADLHLQTDGITRMLVESAGNVGIGTPSPFAKLHVLGSKSLGAVGHFTNTAIIQDGYGVLGECKVVSGVGYGGYFEGGKVGSSSSVFPKVNGGFSYFGSYGEVVTMEAFQGSGTNYGVYGYARRGNINYGIYGYAWGGTGTSTSYGVYGQAIGTEGTNYAGYFNGDVTVSGTLSKGGGSFKIDHPLDAENKYLYHSFVESPDMMNIYNGNVITNANGEAIVLLPKYFEPLNKEFRYQLTVIEQWAQAIISQEINNNQFSIKTDKPNIKVSWQVTGIRQDAFANAHRIQVEEDKPTRERGKYLHPEVFGMPREMSVDYHPEREAQRKKMEEQNRLNDEGRH